jgi:hypothetical protein
MSTEQLAAIVTKIQKAAAVFELGGLPPRVAIKKALEYELPQIETATELELQMLRRAAYAVES